MKFRRVLLGLGLAVSLQAASTTLWEMSGYQDFIKGRFQGVALDRDGRLTLAPKLDLIFNTGQPMVWSIAQAPDGTVYAGTGHRGRVYRVTPAGVSSLLWSAEQAEVFALAVDGSGVVYAGTSPDGKVVRIQDGKAVEVLAPKAKYIWSLAFGKDGSLYVGTGEPANIYRVDPSGKAEIFYETGQSNVTSLGMDREGRVLAGTEPNGLLYRISAKDKAFVLYDSSLPEIRSIMAGSDGIIYAAALGGSLASRTGQLINLQGITGTAPIATSTTTITVTDTPSQAGAEIKPKAEVKQSQAAVATGVVSASPVVEVAGADKSAIYKINPDLTVETLWTSKEENVYDLIGHSNGELYFATDAQGRIYRLNKERKAALIVQTTEGVATRLLETKGGLMAATGDIGKLFRLEDGASPIGVYESPVHDSGTVARWGRISWRARTGKAEVQTRTGNSARPDKTWSDWSAALSDPDRSLISSPNARFVQWRMNLSGPGPVIENVTLAYLPQNTPPVVRSITVAASAQKAPASTSAASGSAYSITVTDSGETSAAAGTPSQTMARGGTPQIQISWQADDPDGDRLVYALYFRGLEETQWKMLRANMFENSLLLDGDVLADGRYVFRVVASDRPSNTPSLAREAEMVSSPVLIDNTPPVVKIGPSQRSGTHFEAEVEAADETSALRRCEYSVDAGPWAQVEAVDGLTDSPQERFHIVVDSLRAGEHLLVVRVYDTAGNAGLAKLVIR